MTLFGIPCSSEALCFVSVIVVAVLLLADRILGACEDQLIAELLKTADEDNAEIGEITH